MDTVFSLSDFFTVIGSLWETIWNGGLSQITVIFSKSLNEVLASLLGTQTDNVIFKGFIGFVSSFLGFATVGSSTLGSLTVFELLFGVGIPFMIAYRIAKWFSDLVT